MWATDSLLREVLPSIGTQNFTKKKSKGFQNLWIHCEPHPYPIIKNNGMNQEYQTTKNVCVCMWVCALCDFLQFLCDFSEEVQSGSDILDNFHA